MKMKTFAVITAIGLSAMAASAAHVWEDPSGWWDNHWTIAQEAQKFHANEVTLDVFAAYIAAERGIDDLFDTSIRESDGNGLWGGGVGLNYFFTRELGIGGDLIMADNDGKFIDSMNASLIARLPWERAGLAPYIFGGGGRMTNPWEWTAHAGIGLEWRLNSLTGIFADGRYVWANGSKDNEFDGDHLLLRAGLRLAF